MLSFWYTVASWMVSVIWCFRREGGLRPNSWLVTEICNDMEYKSRRAKSKMLRYYTA